MTNSNSTARAFGGAIDLGVACLAAVSVGFVTFAMPDDIFSGLIGATHLPDIVAAAAPPLGMTARLAALGVGAVLTFVLVWGLMRALEPKVTPARVKLELKEADPDAPRLRRADAHPDAPSRRPLFAGVDLGEPADEYEPVDIYELETPEEAEVQQPAGVSGLQGYAKGDIAPPGTGQDAPLPTTRDPAPAASRKLPRFLDIEEGAVPQDPVVPNSRKRGVEALSAQLPEPPELDGDNSIGSLMHRLERGLSERAEPAEREEPPLPQALASAAEPNGTLSPEGVRHRLRSAISDLNQIGNRG